uniref:GM07804p n=1 Tax=Drosophila melanogaster TaxID=7227 RepID=Q8T3M9_DROME|nr:GM07804p [Drosophila melanogaster]
MYKANPIRHRHHPSHHTRNHHSNNEYISSHINISNAFHQQISHVYV